MKDFKAICIVENTTKKPYATFTDKIILLKKGEIIMVLEPEHLKEIEKVVGAKFKQ